MLSYRISAAAAEDIQSVIDYALNHFGEDALDRYLRLIDLAIQSVCNSPDRGMTFSDSIRKIHLSAFKKKSGTGGALVKNPRHILFYRIDGNMIDLVRLLHDSMDYESHLP